MLAKSKATAGGSQQELTIRKAAMMLNVSCSFVRRLVSAGEVKGARTLPSGNLRIPLAEVERVKADMSKATRHALDSLYDITEPARRQQGAVEPSVRRPRGS